MNLVVEEDSNNLASIFRQLEFAAYSASRQPINVAPVNEKMFAGGLARTRNGSPLEATVDVAQTCKFLRRCMTYPDRAPVKTRLRLNTLVAHNNYLSTEWQTQTASSTN